MHIGTYLRTFTLNNLTSKIMTYSKSSQSSINLAYDMPSDLETTLTKGGPVDGLMRSHFHFFRILVEAISASVVEGVIQFSGRSRRGFDVKVTL